MPSFSPRWVTVRRTFADEYKAFNAWVFLPEVCALQRMIGDLKGTPFEERTLKRILFLPNTLALYSYSVSGIWRYDLSHGGGRPVGKFEVQASIACIVWGNIEHFRNILKGWETHLKRSPEAGTPLVVEMLEVSRHCGAPSTLAIDASVPSSMRERNFT